MAITQIDVGGYAAAPVGPLKIRLDAAADVAMSLLDANTAAEIRPAGVVSAREVLFVPQGTEVLVRARKRDGRAFEPGDMVGVTVSSPSPASPGIVVRVPVDAGGRAEIQLLQISGAIPRVTLSDPTRAKRGARDGRQEGVGEVSPPQPSTARAPRPVGSRQWHTTGTYGYHAHHSAGPSVGAWCLIVSSSASLLVGRPRAEVGRLIEVVYGIAMTARGGGPEMVGLCRDNQVADLSASLDTETPDWETLLGVTPAPWSRVLPGVQQASTAAGPQGLVVVIVDGEPVDAEEVVHWLATTPSASLTCVVALGRSGFDTHQHSQSFDWWEEEMPTLGGLTDGGRHRLVTLQDLSRVADSATALADAMFPN